MSTAKRLRSIKLSDEVWETLRIYAEANGLPDRTKVVEQLVAAHIPAKYRPEVEPGEGQVSIWEVLAADGEGCGR